MRARLSRRVPTCPYVAGLICLSARRYPGLCRPFPPRIVLLGGNWGGSRVRDMTAGDWAPFTGLMGVALGFGLSEIASWRRRSRERRSRWLALHAELELCARLVETYLTDPIKAPLYRLPTKAYGSSFPALLGAGDVTEEDSRALTEFFNEVEDSRIEA